MDAPYRKRRLSIFRSINIAAFFLETKLALHITSFMIAIHFQGLSAAYNECDFLDFDILVTQHFKSAYLRFY